MELDRVAKLCQNCAQNRPVIVLGSGASVTHNIKGMGELAVHLGASVLPDVGEEAGAWTHVKAALKSGDHLEAALEKHALPDSLVRKVVRCTWDFIAADDYALLQSAITGQTTFPLTALLSGLFRSTSRNIDVITTNYDRVVEYAADSGGFISRNGFLPGYMRRADGAENLVFRQGQQNARTVTLWKVHGSLDWFIDPAGGVISLPLMKEPPEGLIPLIVTPGVSKYQRTHEEPFRSAIHGADRVLKSATAIICVGYGFRDSHIHPKLVTRCRIHDVPILVVARTLTPEARDFLKVNGGRHFVAIEDHTDGMTVYTRDHPDGVVIDGEKRWQLPALNELIGF